MRIVLLANYEPDAQQSMLRFGAMLEAGLTARGHEVRVVRPRKVFGRRASGGLAKWLGYIDKYVVFPRALRRHAADADVVHVVDHSNALYVPRTRAMPWIATCHDLLAVRGALGEDTDCPASALGRRLQRIVVAGLARADAIACDSTSTLSDVERLVPQRPGQERRVVLLGLNKSYGAVTAADARVRLGRLDAVPWDEPFLLHVGSNLARKNKPGVLRVFGRVKDRWPGNLVLAGAPWTEELHSQARALGVEGRTFAVPELSDEELGVAYARAQALLYPSKCEGFGWPVIEAQACGCPVICSDRTSLPEVAGEAGLVFALEDEAGMAAAVLQLSEPDFRAGVVARGRANVGRFNVERMMDDYGEIYARLRGRSAAVA